LVHRGCDISPHNVLLPWEGAAKVSDFGIAKARAASNASASVLIKGKPSYMSPEQVNGRPLVSRVQVPERVAERRRQTGF
jgi:serine/threonine-protein kinase